ncbi:MAG TPA: cysteine--tRNA ligase [Chloroflexota bacterium]|nr:cysteine--tRNA ligase [Chloroflexota bacterium]
MLRLYNTLTHQVEDVIPLRPDTVGMYTCGPTVYRYVHIGNLRSYLMADWIRRTLVHHGLGVRQIKNITDVGHMRQDMLDRGEDKMIAAALAEGKTPAEIAAFYTEAFHQDEAALNILPANVFPKATDHVPQMVAMIERLIKRGFAYQADGNVYFDVRAFPAYGRLSANRLADLQGGERAEADPLKRNQADFALWKAAEPGRMVKWPSPWGDGFPGWHIECSAMSTHYLGPQIDLHTGGVDNIFPHHEDEIAQSEGATGQTFVRSWVHGQHLLADGLKMAKSTGNSYTLADLIERGFDPMAFRYLCLTVHYRTRLNFTFASLRAAQKAYDRLRRLAWNWARSADDERDEETTSVWREQFWSAIDDDLGMPTAISLLWSMARSNLPARDKWSLLAEWDDLLGLRLADAVEVDVPRSAQVGAALAARVTARHSKQYAISDRLRTELQSQGVVVSDRATEPHLEPVAILPRVDRLAGAVSSANAVPSLLNEPDQVEFSVQILANGHLADLQRCLASVDANVGDHSIEVIVVDNGTSDGSGEWLQKASAADSRIRLLRADHNLGEAEGRNLGLRQSRGKIILQLDPAVELAGDVFTPIAAALKDPKVGLVGRWGLRSHDLRHFEEHPGPEVDAVEGYFCAFPRQILKETDFYDPHYRFYRNLDINFSFEVHWKGYATRVLDLPAILHEHRGWTALSNEEREKQSKRNFRRFLNKWGHDFDLLIEPVLEEQRPGHHRPSPV